LVKQWTWPVAILGLLVLNFGITAALVIRSANDPSFAAESNAYEKAVRWDDHLAQIKFNRSLGWTPRIEITQTGNGRHELTVTLLDAKGDGLDNTSVRVDVFHHARAADVRHLTLAEDGTDAGIYRTPIDIPRAGLWQVRLTATKMHSTFTADETVTVDHADFATTAPGGKGQ
jgi:nitrogen fixation protein FixH